MVRSEVEVKNIKRLIELLYEADGLQQSIDHDQYKCYDIYNQLTEIAEYFVELLEENA